MRTVWATDTVVVASPQIRGPAAEETGSWLANWVRHSSAIMVGDGAAKCMTARTTTLIVFSAMPQVSRPGCKRKPKWSTTQLPGLRRSQQSPSEPLTEDDLRSLMATGVFFVLGGGWLARYFRNRILRGPTSRLPRPVQASTTQGGVAEALRQITSPVTPGCGFPDNCSGSCCPPRAGARPAPQ